MVVKAKQAVFGAPECTRSEFSEKIRLVLMYRQPCFSPSSLHNTVVYDNKQIEGDGGWSQEYISILQHSSLFFNITAPKLVCQVISYKYCS